MWRGVFWITANTSSDLCDWSGLTGCWHQKRKLRINKKFLIAYILTTFGPFSIVLFIFLTVKWKSDRYHLNFKVIFAMTKFHTFYSPFRVSCSILYHASRNLHVAINNSIRLKRSASKDIYRSGCCHDLVRHALPESSVEYLVKEENRPHLGLFLEFLDFSFFIALYSRSHCKLFYFHSCF